MKNANLNIPIYRAKKIGSNECAEGFLIKKNYDNQKVRYFILEDKNTEVAMTYEIDLTTLAIHFPDMLDSQGNKIFASLSATGKGGDVITYDEDIRIIAIYKNGTFIFKDSMNLAIVPSSRYLRTKVIGIQQ